MHRKKTEIALIKKYGLLLPGTTRGSCDPAVSTAWEPPETAWQGSRLAIEPGRGIGPLELGMASGKILEALRRLYTGLGLRLWREGAFHPKLLLDAAYIEGMSAVLEEEYKYRYFELAFVSR